MESLSKQELISTITKQADQIKRYEARLRDVVAAYKGLVKEKEALEISLKALNKTELPSEGDDSVAALTLSLSTLTAEKARMEEAFQADKKVTRDKYENAIAALKEETKSLVQQHLAEVNSLKSKIAYEIQERENERADHMAMIKELNVKLNSERKSKEKLEDKVVTSSESQASQAELEKRVRDLSSSLEAAQRQLQRAEARTVETPALLVRLQQKLALLEQSHSIAIREEQIKAKRCEEAARKSCARQEERVALLEGRVAELSHTLGQYDAARRHDRRTIQRLHAALDGRLLRDIAPSHAAAADAADTHEEPQQKSETDNEKLADSEYLHTLIDKIHILKKELIAENDKLGSPIDITTVFKVDGYENIHIKCREEYDALKAEFEAYKVQNSKKIINVDESEIEDLKSEMAMLKEKLETYKMLLDEEKQDKADTLKLYEEKMKSEQDYYKELNSDLKTRVQSLEKQVQTQRDRYAALLEETDNYIRSRNDRSRKVSVEDGHWKEGMLTDVTAPPHMLHYAHELARKDLDISQLRKEKHILEGQYRDCQREGTIEKERFKEVIRTLKEEIDRLRRIQSREGANLEYLKNVVMAYLMSTDYAGRKHMLNAIAAVLHFTTTERNLVMSNL
ncbi:GRIP and coiled-coil domain-containing protein 1 isoform X1 [Galleria mellonella]|uniref:GRIP and coiled-coil domain-containing protein 1 isoform X1 n=1 Tax=Galleria mellonella TaxID=7137 RepID=A0A6J1WL05_GALME|nr:GRIP and coiled-coil domain-containing protein 1 isoform X1 [Galleria mellonella]XP_026752005.2 GRIP and coiled-coil domain-containing protein 1 isoform X1 [Galleria mellonella]